MSVSGFEPVATNRNLLEGGTLFFDAANTLATLSSQVATIQQMYTAYGFTGDSELPIKAKQIEADVSTLNALINQGHTASAPT